MEFPSPLSTTLIRSAMHSMSVTGRRVILLMALLLAVYPSIVGATISFEYGLCNPSDGCDQSINFTPAQTATFVVGDTNPPQPNYDVFATSSGFLVLHAAGSTIDADNGLGFTTLLLIPEAPYGWGAIEFQLDSLNKAQPLDSGGLTLSAWDQFGSEYSFLANFPSEGNHGENQHYHLHADFGEVITKLQISYVDPLGMGNTIQDIHNIDVNTVAVPEPATLLLVISGMIVVARRLRGTIVVSGFCSLIF